MEAAKTAETAAEKPAAAETASAAQKAAAATPRRVREWSVGDVCAFFTDLKLGEYDAAIVENEVNGRMLQDLQAADGLGELGIKSKIHLLRIKHGLEKAEDRSKDTCGNAVVRCCALPRPHHIMPCFRPLCRAAAHVRHVQVQACVRPHVVPAAA